MAPYTFNSTSGGTASASSTGKVQFVVNGTSTDTVTLQNLANDAVTTNGTLGNTGLAGTWADMGTAQIGASVYRVYNHSTTQAQVLVASANVVTPTNPQSILITRADSNGVTGSYVEEFGVSGTTALNTVVDTVDTAAWTIQVKDFLSADALVPELQLQSGASGYTHVDDGLGTDAKLKFGPTAGQGNASEPRLNLFSSKAGAFSAIAFNYLELNSSYAHSTNGGSIVKFYNADGLVIHETIFEVPLATGTGKLGSYNYTLPTGLTAASFSITTNTNDQWFMDGLTMTPVASTYLPHTASTVDATPLLSGTYASNLGAGDVIKIYDNTGTVYLGDATVDTATKTWTYQVTTPQPIGSDTYQAKIVNGTTNVATSNNYTLNVLASSLNITAISQDTGTSTSDFITSDNTLTYNGALPKPLATGEKVLVQILNEAGSTVLRSSAVTPTAGSTTWTWTDPASGLADGNYIIRATIVANDGLTPVPAYGTNGTDTQPMTIDATAPLQTVSFSSMTKDSGTALNANWTTADGSAGRLVSGTVSAALAANETLEVYANGVKIGNAVVNGTSWEITDTKGYTGNWEYTAKVVNAVGDAGPQASRTVTTDFTEAPPVITSVTDSANASIANSGTTTNSLKTVSGTGLAGDTIYLYDNNYTTLVGTAVVNGSGAWSVTSLTGTFTGSNTFAAKQVDVNGNHSDFSNQWTVTAPGANMVPNGDFSNGATGYTFFGTLQSTAVSYDATDNYIVGDIKGMVGSKANTIINSDDIAGYTGAPDTLSQTATQTNGALSWSTAYLSLEDNSLARQRVGRTFESLAGKVGESNQVLTGNVWTSDGGTLHTILSTTVNVEAGKTYDFSFDYVTSFWSGGPWFDLPGTGGRFAAVVDGVRMEIPYTLYNKDAEIGTGTMTATYTATETKAITIKYTGKGSGSHQYGDYALDNISFTEAAPAVPVTPFSTGPTPNPDTLSYTKGALDALASNDTITATSTGLQATLAAGGAINGGAGVDTLKLAAGTTLNLMTLTNNQTVKSIQEVEVFQLQGTSSLTLSANNVLSLGGSHATTMSAYSFTSSTGGTASTSSTGKVQFVVNATGTDTVTLATLKSDGLTGNTGLDGAWNYMGTTTANGATYKVYDHSTTQAQVLVSSAATVSTTTSPLVLDLNGDGVQTMSLEAGTQFDLLNIGSKQSVGWVDKQDGLLVMDLNGDQLVNSGAELLGNNTKLADGSFAKDGWAALAQFDGNADGVIDAKDAAFANLKVWVDGNSDGASGLGELKSLADVGVQSINLNHDGVMVEQNGNTLQGFSSYTTTDGKTHQIVDAWLNTQLAGDSAAVAAATPVAAAARVAAATPVADALLAAAAGVVAADQVVDVTLNELAPTGTEPVVLQPASALIQNKPYTLSPEQMQEFQDLVTEVTNAVNEGAVNVAISEVTPTGTQPVVFEVPTHCEPSVFLPGTSTDAAATADQVVDVTLNELAPTGTEPVVLQPATHCEPSVFLPESMVLDLNAASWNKPYTLSAEQLSELGLPASTDGSLASLNVTDVLLSLAQGVTQSALQVNGTPVTADTLNLSNLLGPDAAPTQLTATGTVQHEGQTYTYQVDANLQALLDQQQLTTS
jgi:hypothetical protein